MLRHNVKNIKDIKQKMIELETGEVIDTPEYICLIARQINLHYHYFVDKINDVIDSITNINKILVENKKKENELEWRILKLESILQDKLEGIIIEN